MIHFSLSEIQLPLQYNWKIARGSTDFKLNFIVGAERSGRKVSGEVAPNIRYDETPDRIRSEFGKFRNSLPTADLDLGQFEEFLDSLSLSSSLRFGIESAFVHLLCKERSIKVHDFFQLTKPGKVPTARSLPIMEIAELENFWREYDLERFPFLKVKVNKESALETLKTVSGFTAQPLLVDGNESWTDVSELESVLKKLSGIPILVLEQPFPAGYLEPYKYLKKISPFPLFADESIIVKPDFNLLEQQFHGVNVKLMKAGGYVNAIGQLKEAKKRGMKTMLGCMVETSLGISSAMHLCSLADIADLDGFMILKNEPLGLAHEKKGFLFF
jgi:L-alanine-DL-glutamate epimerase-like enolase superfamily enzyme